MEEQYNKTKYGINYFEKRCKCFAYPILKSEFVEEWFVVRFICEDENYTCKHIEDNKACTYAVDRLRVGYNERRKIVNEIHLETLPFATVEFLIEYLIQMNIDPEFYRASV